MYTALMVFAVVVVYMAILLWLIVHCSRVHEKVMDLKTNNRTLENEISQLQSENRILHDTISKLEIGIQKIKSCFSV